MLNIDELVAMEETISRQMKMAEVNKRYNEFVLGEVRKAITELRAKSRNKKAVKKAVGAS